jgi:hypothetical protein
VDGCAAAVAEVKLTRAGIDADVLIPLVIWDRWVATFEGREFGYARIWGVLARAIVRGHR